MRLLGISPWEVPDRTDEKVDLEYDKDKYAELLTLYEETGLSPTIESIRQVEFGVGSVCASFWGDLALTTTAEAQQRYNELLYETMRQEIEQSTTVVELGCGYGYNLWMLKRHFPYRHFLGGELSSNAVELAAKLSIEVSQFNFYDSFYKLIEDAQSPITVFTSHAIEQLPKSESFFRGLLPHRDKIQTVFHFEPMYELYDSTLLGLMRQRYTEVNDYNRDLLSELQQRDIQIVRTEANVFGMNPLNPTSIVQWEYRI